MPFNSRQLMLIAGLGSAALLAGAFLFQIMGYAPCKMCYWQRYPHFVAAGLGAVGFFFGWRIVAALGAVAAAVTAGTGMFHVGVEQKWWDGPSSCSGGGGLAGLDGSSLLSTDVVDKVVMCDEISWQFLGLSMPGWNALLSLCLVAIWVLALKQKA